MKKHHKFIILFIALISIGVIGNEVYKIVYSEEIAQEQIDDQCWEDRAYFDHYQKEIKYYESSDEYDKAIYNAGLSDDRMSNLKRYCRHLFTFED